MHDVTAPRISRISRTDVNYVISNFSLKSCFKYLNEREKNSGYEGEYQYQKINGSVKNAAQSIKAHTSHPKEEASTVLERMDNFFLSRLVYCSNLK